jgi:hypothetical protein
VICPPSDGSAHCGCRWERAFLANRLSNVTALSKNANRMRGQVLADRSSPLHLDLLNFRGGKIGWLRHIVDKRCSGCCRSSFYYHRTGNSQEYAPSKTPLSLLRITSHPSFRRYGSSSGADEVEDGGHNKEAMLPWRTEDHKASRFQHHRLCVTGRWFWNCSNLEGSDSTFGNIIGITMISRHCRAAISLASP